MSVIEWTKDFIIGNNKIDLQHMELINIYNALLVETKKGEGNNKIKEYLKKLADYATLHFDTEEKYFEEIKYPSLDRQKKEHLDFKKKVINLIKDFQAKKIRLNMDILDFLKDWINNHIINEDCKAREFIKKASETNLEDNINGINYNISGEGNIVFFIHDNIHSSNYFSDILHFYQKKFKVVTFDLLGCGNSLRNNKIEGDFWQQNSEIINKICLKHKLNDIIIFSYNFGCYTALNTALKYPELVKGIVLYNPEKPIFEKEDLKILMRNREKSKKSSESFFYSRMHGDDWEEVINNDSKIFCNLKDGKKNIFPHKQSNIKCPVNTFYSMKDFNSEKFLNFLEFSEKIPNSRIIFENYSEDPLFLKSPQKFLLNFENFVKALFSQNVS
ncbi:MAG: bacteriohemerythrin [Candidatus Muirbacterium halophilum]|nr:bacteriohemerythrin [Candidatus Muirbacterium halophilum]MCK9475842.1 bacteriohemerythrin [Candidatus Muirbacterium halophilum]